MPVRLAGHCLHLPGLFTELVLVDGELLGDLRARLDGENVPEGDVTHLLLHDDEVLFDDLLGLGDEPPLQRHDLLDHLKGARVRALEFAPSVHVHWVLEPLGEGLDLGPLLEQLLLDAVRLLAQDVDVGDLVVEHMGLAPERPDLELERAGVLESLVLDLPLVEGVLLDIS